MYGEYDLYFAQLLARRDDEGDDLTDIFTEPPVTAKELRFSLVVAAVGAVILFVFALITG